MTRSASLHHMHSSRRENIWLAPPDAREAHPDKRLRCLWGAIQLDLLGCHLLAMVQRPQHLAAAAVQGGERKQGSRQGGRQVAR